MGTLSPLTTLFVPPCKFLFYLFPNSLHLRKLKSIKKSIFFIFRNYYLPWVKCRLIYVKIYKIANLTAKKVKFKTMYFVHWRVFFLFVFSNITGWLRTWAKIHVAVILRYVIYDKHLLLYYIFSQNPFSCYLTL